MKFGTSIIISFLGIIALVAELVLYFVLGFAAAFSGDLRQLTGTAFFFVSLMALTATIAILAPICATIELLVKRKNISIYLMLGTLGLMVALLTVFGLSGARAVSESLSKQEQGKEPEGRQVPDAAKVAYLDKVVAKNVRVGRSILDELGVFGEIKNDGDRILNKVEITIFCLDKDGSPVFEKKYHPVLVTKFSFHDNEPLKPNYSRKFGVKLDDAPSDWARKVRVEVTDIEFQPAE